MFPDDDIFIDQSKTKAKKWREENDKKLKQCDLVLLIITPAALKSDEVEREVRISNDLSKMILPCKMNATNLDWNELKWNLGSLDGISFDNAEDLLTSLFSVVDKIRKEHLKKLQNISDSSFNIITVHLAKKIYSDGNKILISGQVKELLSNTNMIMKILDPNDQIVGLDQIEVGSDKKYSIEFTAGGSLMKNEGNYTVVVQYGGASRTAKTTFTFTGSSGIPKSLTTEEFIILEGSNSQIKYRILGGKVISAVKIVGTFSLIFGIESTKNGEINLTIPRSILDARIEDNDEDLVVLVDNKEANFDEVKTDDERILTIPFSAHSQEIEIVGIPDVLTPLSSILENPKSIQNQNDQIHEISLTVSFDRTVYPLKSKLYVRVNCQDIIFGKDINLEILNLENKIIASKQINPITYPDSELKQAGIYEESFQMNDADWKVGELYTIRASHGNAVTEDTCTIDERTPVIQTDKSVYLLGSDMIITIIDPDADKDSNKPEFVGNSPESFLTISSSVGKIEGYKLRETGDSTGIFQGIIGLIGTSVDGTAIPYVLGEENISKTQGSGIDDGFLQVKRNDEIKITYKRKSDVITLSAFPSNFGASIELDQKVYTWTDKVRITIVSPDFNNDPNKVERIGNNNDGTLVIKTRLGKIENYELVETGPDTGIFVGEIRLTGFQYDQLPQETINNFGKTFGKGPRSGILATNSDDGLTVEFKTQTETIVASALIRWNIGEVQWKQPTYSLGDTGSFNVIDPDMNYNPNLIDIFKIRVWSDSDPVGTEVLAIETGPEKGIFFGDIQFGTETIDGVSIKVSPGDSVVAEYVDYTLPDPYKKGDSLKITATAEMILYRL